MTREKKKSIIDFVKKWGPFILTLTALVAVVWRTPTIVYGAVFETCVKATIQRENRPIVDRLDKLIEATEFNTFATVMSLSQDDFERLQKQWISIKKNDLIKKE